MMHFDSIGRRRFLQLGLSAGITGLAGCTGTDLRAVLRGAPEILPKKWIRSLPSDWQYKPLEISKNQDPFGNAFRSRIDLLALSDGWLEVLAEKTLSPIRSTGLDKRLGEQAWSFLKSLKGGFASYVLPIGFTPWVMLFRNGENFLQEANNSWDALLDPALKGLVVLPRSPRLLISISERLKSYDSLRQLKAQALTFDDKNALNWLSNGDARVAVVPLHQCLTSVRMDPRLSIAFPKDGVPLHWTLLVRPLKTRQPLPVSWIEKAWSPPLIGRIMAEGWIPAIPISERLEQIKRVPSRFKPLIFPSADVWSRCWSLPPLTNQKKEDLRSKWYESTP
ncbi:ABC transporter substrate-binding protein [Prochlorococcus sp. MIT 1341]|uniref:ABC transporter substrate-binding protein n=1 Tax=Prochlorococcus sp. MIT 1341 TaxID=3096221 RepID=UPI002A747447|nr:ABC transporter substrate-binding protein [Prochlorococcus sp. MIT 1341]